MPSNKLSYGEVIERINERDLGFYLREIVSSGLWSVEACCDLHVGTFPVTAIFKRDVLKVSHVYTQGDLDKIIVELRGYQAAVQAVLVGL